MSRKVKGHIIKPQIQCNKVQFYLRGAVNKLLKLYYLYCHQILSVTLLLWPQQPDASDFGNQSVPSLLRTWDNLV